ncbi:MAG: PepSY domain-containing protein [Betaproteobacteria bacterium]
MNSIGQPIRALAFALLACAMLAQPLFADERSDHDRALNALESGEILPLRGVLEKVERDTPGRVLEVDLEHKKGRWVYEIKLLRQGGALTKLLIDARDGSIIERRENGEKRSW